MSQPISTLNALSPLDGRYASKLDALRPWLSESAFMKQRVFVEIHWLLALGSAGLADVPRISQADADFLLSLANAFTDADAQRIKEIEAVTNHDVKAVEYFLKEKVSGRPDLLKASEFIHFACTSEDINNTAHGLMLRGARDTVLLPQLRKIHDALTELALANASVIAPAGAVGKSIGACSKSAELIILARGVRPSAFALASLIITSADAPSLILLLLATVTVPPSSAVINAGFNDDIFASSKRLNSSSTLISTSFIPLFAALLPFSAESLTETISEEKIPDLLAA